MSMIRDARLAAGLTQAQVTELMLIPTRTLQHWENGDRACPPWAERLIVKELEELKQQRDSADVK